MSTGERLGLPAVIAHTPAGEILEWNDGATAMYGWSHDDAFGHDIFQLIPTGFPEPLEDIFAILETGSGWHGLVIQRSKEGIDLCVEATLKLEDGLIIQQCSLAKTNDVALSVGPFARCLLDTYPGSVFLFDLVEYRTVFLHGQQLRSLGYTHEEINSMGNDLASILHPDELEKLPERIKEYGSLSQGETHEYVHRVRAKDGSYRQISTVASVFAWDSEGNPSHLVGFARDVTEDLEGTRTLRLLQEQLKFSLSYTGMIAWVWDFATNEVIRVGDVRSIYGSIEPTADAFTKAIHPDDWHLSDEAIQKAREGKAMDGVQMRIIRTDGQVRWVEERGAYHYDETGRATHMVGVTIDVTEQRRNEEIIRRTHRSLRLALQAARASTWQWDCLTDLIVVSDDAFELFGLPRGAPPTMAEWLQRIHPQDRSYFSTEAQKTAKEGMDLCIDFRVVMPDGKKKPVRAVAQRAADSSGNAVEVIGIVIDLSIFRGLMRADEDAESDGWAA